MFYTEVNINFYWYLPQKLLFVTVISKFKGPKLQKNLTNLLKKFCEFPPWVGIHKTFLPKTRIEQSFMNTYPGTYPTTEKVTKVNQKPSEPQSLAEFINVIFSFTLHLLRSYDHTRCEEELFYFIWHFRNSKELEIISIFTSEFVQNLTNWIKRKPLILFLFCWIPVSSFEFNNMFYFFISQEIM